MDFPNLTAGIGAAIGVGIAFWLMGRRNQQFAPRIEPVLKERGALTLPELQAALDMKGFSARGKVAMALNAMTMDGKVETIPAPDGTPMLDRVNHIKYRLKG